jgi:rubrerythrin
MSSESSTERTVSITLPADLDEWLDQQASAAEVDRDELLVQLLASYRIAADQDGHLDADALEIEQADIAETVRSQLDEQLPARLDGELDSRIEQAVEQAVTERLSEATNSVQRQLSNRIDSVETEFDEKISDVRERVIQVKKEADSKAPADHTHDQLESITEIQRTLAELETELDGLQTEFEEQVPEHERTLTELDDRVEQMQDRLQTVAWVVSDLREAQESQGGLEAVERIKRAAAKADIERANCENCGDGVTLSLLTDPECPHCNATVTNVEPASGWFGSPTLLTAAQLESGEQS